MRYVFLSSILLAGIEARGQSVVAAKAGLVHLAEGITTLDDSPFAGSRGRYRDIPEGSVFKTGDGRAEVLLTPGVFLWIGPQSGIRIVRNSLLDAQVQLLEGSVIVGATDPLPDNSVTLLSGEWQVELPGQGLAGH